MGVPPSGRAIRPVFKQDASPVGEGSSNEMYGTIRNTVREVSGKKQDPRDPGGPRL